jgi:hypothetical protein
MTTRSTAHAACRMLVAVLPLLGGAGAATAQETLPTTPESLAHRPVSRTEVLADLLLWRQAGFTGVDADLEPGEAYDRRIAAYHQLRYGPAFAATVARLEREQHGDAALTAQQQTPGRTR